MTTKFRILFATLAFSLSAGALAGQPVSRAERGTIQALAEAYCRTVTLQGSQDPITCVTSFMETAQTEGLRDAKTPKRWFDSSVDEKKRMAHEHKAASDNEELERAWYYSAKSKVLLPAFQACKNKHNAVADQRGITFVALVTTPSLSGDPSVGVALAMDVAPKTARGMCMLNHMNTASWPSLIPNMGGRQFKPVEMEVSFGSSAKTAVRKSEQAESQE